MHIVHRTPGIWNFFDEQPIPVFLVETCIENSLANIFTVKLITKKKKKH